MKLELLQPLREESHCSLIFGQEVSDTGFASLHQSPPSVVCELWPHMMMMCSFSKFVFTLLLQKGCYLNRMRGLIQCVQICLLRQSPWEISSESPLFTLCRTLLPLGICLGTTDSCFLSPLGLPNYSVFRFLSTVSLYVWQVQYFSIIVLSQYSLLGFFFCQ